METDADRDGASHPRPAVASCAIRKGVRHRGAGYRSKFRGFLHENPSISLSIGLCMLDLAPVPRLRQPNGCQHLLQSSSSGMKPRPGLLYTCYIWKAGQRHVLYCRLCIGNSTVKALIRVKSAGMAMPAVPNFGGCIAVLCFPQFPAVNGGSQHKRQPFTRNTK